MAREGQRIRGQDASEVLAAAERSLARAESATGRAEQASSEAEGALKRVAQRAKRIERSLKVEQISDTRYGVVEETGAGVQRPMRAGLKKAGAFTSREAAERERSAIAMERAQAAEEKAQQRAASSAQTTADAVEKAETRKTRARKQATPSGRSPAVAAEDAEAKAAEQSATRVEAAARRKNAARREGSAIAGNTAEFERRVRENADILARGLDPEKAARVAALQAKTPPAEQQRAAAELEAARSAAYRPGTDLARIPGMYPGREPGPFGQVYRPGGVVAETGVTQQMQEGARSPLWKAQQRLTDALGQQADSARELRRANRNAQLYSARERADLEDKHRGNVASVDAARQNVKAIQRDVDATVAHTRAQNESDQALIAEARARGRQPIPSSRSLVPYNQPGRGLVATGVSRDDPYSQLTAAERAMLNPQAAPATLGARLAQSGARTAAPDHAAQLAANEAAAATARAAERQAVYAQAVGDSEQAIQRWSTQLGYANQNLRRHGTFTTEFIDAARKGEVTYREWGWQIGAAATKFGAWTAAGAGIYGALSAVGKIGQGALQSASGVETLRRTVDNVSSGQAQQGFRAMAAHFNVPIDTVSDAQMRMGAVFHNQADAATAARAALYALQTGEVDVASSTKDLIAINQAYGTSAQGLVDLFDELNFVQNRYGARIPDMETGVASASGSFKQMGGSLNELVAAFTTLQRHGTTGNIASTIFRRIPNELAKPSNRTVLQANNIDPTAAWPQLLRQAQQAVASGANARQIAAAISGPQFAGRFMNLLTDPGLYGKVLGQLNSGAAKGASEQELQHVLSEVSQQIKAIGVQLGNLGSNLAQSGLLPILGSGVVLLRETLSLVNTMLGVFNQLPAPIKTAVMSIGLLKAGLAGARRLSLGESLAGRGGLAGRVAPYLMEDQTRRERRVGSKGIDAAITSATDENERATRAALDAATAERVTIGDTQRRVARASELRAAGELTIAEEEKIVERANLRAAQAIERREAAEIAATIAAERMAEAQAMQTRVQGAANAIPFGRGARAARDEAYVSAARREGILGTPSLRMNVPTPERVERLDYPGPTGAIPTSGYTRSIGPQTATGVGPANLGQAEVNQAAMAATAARQQAVGSKRFRDKLSDVSAATRAQVTELNEIRRTQNLGAAATAAGSRAAGAAVPALRAGVIGIRGFAARAAAMIGPEGLLIAGLLALPDVIGAVKGRYQSLQSVSRLQGAGGDLSQQGITQLRQQILERQHQANTLIGTAERSFTDPVVELARAASATGKAVGDAVDAVGRKLGLDSGSSQAARQKVQGIAKPSDHQSLGRTLLYAIPIFGQGLGYSDHKEYEAQLKEYRAYQAAVARRNQIEKNRTSGGMTTGLNALDKNGNLGGQILTEAQADLQDYQRGRINQQQFEQRKQQRLAEVQSALANGRPLTKQQRSNLTDELKKLMDQSDAVVQATTDEIDSRYNLLEARAGGPVAQAELEVQRAQEKLSLAQKGTDKNAIRNAMADLVNAQNAAVDAAKQQAQQTTDALGALVNAGSGNLGGYVSRLRNEIAQLQGSNKPEDMQRLASDQAALRSSLESAGQQQLQDALASARTPAQVNRAYRNYERSFRKAAQAGRPQQQQPGPMSLAQGGLGAIMGGPRAGLPAGQSPEDKQYARMVQAIRRQREQQVYEARASLMDAQSQVTAGAAPAGMPRLQIQLAEIGRKVAMAIKAYGRNSKEALDVIAQQQQAQASVVQEQASLIQAQTAYQAAGQGTQGGEAAANIGGLQRLLAYQKQHPEVFSQADLLGTMTQIREARKQQADQIKQDVDDLINAQYALRESLTDDPVKQAQLEAQRTAAIVRRGGFTNQADRLRAMADKNNARRAAQDAAVQARMDNVQYDVDIGQMTTDQEIAAFQRMLRTMKMGSQMKKQLKQEIGRLKHQSENEDTGAFELGLSNIRIPSLYEVARAVQGGADRLTTPVGPNTTNVHITVNGPQDYQKLGRVLEKHAKGSGKALARAAQMR